MEKAKYYFASIDDTVCRSLESHLEDARSEELSEITLVEAWPDSDPNYVWCSYHGEVGDRSECKKAFCGQYESKSGRGKCIHRGNLFLHGEEVTLKVNQI